jgi:hypothetical protein
MRFALLPDARQRLQTVVRRKQRLNSQVRCTATALTINRFNSSVVVRVRGRGVKHDVSLIPRIRGRN